MIMNPDFLYNFVQKEKIDSMLVLALFDKQFAKSAALFGVVRLMIVAAIGLGLRISVAKP